MIYPFGYVPSPDVNDDESVDIFDVVTVAEAFGSKPGDPNWNPTTDLVQDELIDIFDVVTVVGNFGKLLEALFLLYLLRARVLFHEPAVSL